MKTIKAFVLKNPEPMEKFASPEHSIAAFKRMIEQLPAKIEGFQSGLVFEIEGLDVVNMDPAVSHPTFYYLKTEQQPSEVESFVREWIEKQIADPGVFTAKGVISNFNAEIMVVELEDGQLAKCYRLSEMFPMSLVTPTEVYDVVKFAGLVSEKTADYKLAMQLLQQVKTES